MSEGLNKVMILGNIGADPEFRVTPTGQGILKLRIATNESYLDKNNVRQERTEWHRCSIWGKRGEALSKILSKGDSLFIEGRLSTSSYEKGGQKMYSTEIVATNVILNGRGRGGETQAGAPQQRAEPRATEHRDDFGGGPSAGAGFDGGGDADDIPF